MWAETQIYEIGFENNCTLNRSFVLICIIDEAFILHYNKIVNKLIYFL